MYLRVTEALRQGGSILPEQGSILPEQGSNIYPIIEPRDIWVRLTEEGRHNLIRTLQRVERKDPGYRTIVTPKEGWSDNDSTHNAVLSWLKARDVHVLNVGKEIECLTRALHDPMEVE